MPHVLRRRLETVANPIMIATTPALGSGTADPQSTDQWLADARPTDEDKAEKKTT